MPERSTPRRGLGAALLACCAGLLGAAPAHAEATIAIPADAPVVAGPTASGVSAVAFVRRGDLCMAFLQAGQPRPARLDPGRTGGCNELPVLGPFGWEVVTSRLDDAGRYAELGVTGGAAAWIAFKRDGQTVTRAATKPSPLPGAAAGLRFYAIESAPKATSDEVALLDTFDTVQRAFPPREALEEDEEALPTPPVPAGKVMLQGRRGATRWTLRAWIDRSITPTPLLPERRVALPCVRFSTVAGGHGTDGGELCDDERTAAEPMQIEPSTEACAPIGTHVTVLVRPTVRRVLAVLGDGRSRTIALRAVPGATAGTRAGVAVLGVGVAVRRVVALGPGGRALSSSELGLAPASPSDSCGFWTVYTLLPFPPGLPSTRLGAAPHAARVVTDGVRLCLAVDRAPRPPADCAVPPLDAQEVSIDAQPTADGRFVAAIVPREVAAVRLLLDDDTTRTVTPTAITGPYADLERLVALDVPGPHRVVGSTLLRDDGRVLVATSGPESRPVTHATVLLHRPGHGLPALRVAQLPATNGRGPVTCASLGPPETSCLPFQPGIFAVSVTCAPRQIVVAGLLRHATQRVAILTAAEREVAARTVPLPAVLRRARSPFTSPAAVALAVVGADAAPRTLVVRGPAAVRTTLTLPPAREQCGYRDFVVPDLLG